MIGNPVSIKKFKKLESHEDRVHWLAHAKITVETAEIVDEMSHNIVTRYYVAANGIAVHTVNGTWFANKSIAEAEAYHVEENFAEDWQEIMDKDPIAALEASARHHPDCQCRYCMYGREALPASEY